MARIILRFLGVLILLSNLVIIILSYVTNTNIYKKYGTQILKVTGIFILVVIAFYVALGLAGIS